MRTVSFPLASTSVGRPNAEVTAGQTVSSNACASGCSAGTSYSPRSSSSTYISACAVAIASVAALRTWCEKSRPWTTQNDRRAPGSSASTGAGRSSASAASRARTISCNAGGAAAPATLSSAACTGGSAAPSTTTSACAASLPPKFTSRTPSRSVAASRVKLALNSPRRKSQGAKICHAAPVPPSSPALTMPMARPPGRASTQTPDADPRSEARVPWTKMASDALVELSRSASCTRCAARTNEELQETSTPEFRADARTSRGRIDPPQATAASRQTLKRISIDQPRRPGLLRIKSQKRNSPSGRCA